MTKKVKLSNTGKSIRNMGELRELITQFKDSCPIDDFDLFYEDDGNGGCRLSIKESLSTIKESVFTLFLKRNPDDSDAFFLAIDDDQRVVSSSISDEMREDGDADKYAEHLSLKDLIFHTSNWHILSPQIQNIINSTGNAIANKFISTNFKENEMYYAGMGHYGYCRGLFSLKSETK